MATRKTSAGDTTTGGPATPPIKKSARTAVEAAKPADKAREPEESPEERVYRTLYDGILDRRLAPGTKLKEIPLAQAFGVTRGVVRKTLARLATAKVVTLRSQHGASVAQPFAGGSRPDLRGPAADRGFRDRAAGRVDRRGPAQDLA
ncbi:GntR family transcriptional regulator [Hydrogenophaga sp. UC242_53]|uniref:GntR family transcriptional regulator n=1 Tax=Hydrogenophaga sp. UC242_53 TaxID=3350170 RepID=UPI0036D21E08